MSGNKAGTAGNSGHCIKRTKTPASQSPRRQTILIREDELPEGISMIPRDSVEPDEIKLQKYWNNSKLISSQEL